MNECATGHTFDDFEQTKCACGLVTRIDTPLSPSVDLASIPVFVSGALPADGFWCHPDVLKGNLVPHQIIESVPKLK